jgi:hypothetical protein
MTSWGALEPDAWAFRHTGAQARNRARTPRRLTKIGSKILNRVHRTASHHFLLVVLVARSPRPRHKHPRAPPPARYQATRPLSLSLRRLLSSRSSSPLSTPRRSPPTQFHRRVSLTPPHTPRSPRPYLTRAVAPPNSAAKSSIRSADPFRGRGAPRYSSRRVAHPRSLGFLTMFARPMQEVNPGSS